MLPYIDGFIPTKPWFLGKKCHLNRKNPRKNWGTTLGIHQQIHGFLFFGGYMDIWIYDDMYIYIIIYTLLYYINIISWEQ